MPAEVEVVPQKTRSISKKRKKVKLTTNNVDRWQEKLYLENLPELVQVGYKQLIKKLKEGDPKALAMSLEIANLYKPRTGQVNVVTQIYNKNGGESSGSEKAQSFESILRRLEASGGSGDTANRAQQARDTIVDV